MNFLRRHGIFAVIVLGAIFCGWGVLRGNIEESILAMVPRGIKEEVELFQHSPLSQKLIIVAQADNSAQALSAAEQIREELAQTPWIRPQEKETENIVPFLLRALPGMFTTQDEQTLAAKLSNKGVEEQLSRYQEQLFSLEGLLVKQFLTQDPFYLTELVLNKWARLGQNLSTEYQSGFLSTPDGTLQAGLYDLKADVSQFSTAQQLENWLEKMRPSLPQGVRVFFMGALRYTLENVSVIKRDLLLLSLAGLALLGVVFFVFFRTKRALLIYVLPLLVLPPAAFVCQLIFGHLSGITLGFGSVVAGLSVDYVIYVYFAQQALGGNIAQTRGQISYHLWCNFLTSALCFVALLFSSVEVFEQIAVFALVALLMALLIALYVFPIYFAKAKIPPTAASTFRCLKPLPLKSACWVSIGLLLFGVWGAFHLSLNESLESLNPISRALAQDKQALGRILATEEQALLFSLGATADEARTRNAELSTKLPAPLAVSEIVMPAAQEQENQARWNRFWGVERVETAQMLLRAEAQKRGFQWEAFAPFWQWLENSFTPVAVDWSAWYNPVLKLQSGSYAVVNIVPDNEIYEKIANDSRAVFVSASGLQKKLAKSVKQEALWVVCLALLFNGVAVWLAFKRIKAVIFCFVPVVLGACILFGSLALLKVQVNLFGLIFLPLLVGLGIDYAIFELMKYQADQKKLGNLYPPKALLAAGLSTLAGFGVLVLAHHPVLFMMGLCSLVGIGSAVLAALFILPSLWEHYA